MNSWDIDEAHRRYREHPVLGPATCTLISLRDAADANSDGWAYWRAPSRAARRLMALIEGDGIDPRTVSRDTVREDATPARLRAALIPVKSFRTRHGLAFDIIVKKEG